MAQVNVLLPAATVVFVSPEAGSVELLRLVTAVAVHVSLPFSFSFAPATTHDVAATAVMFAVTEFCDTLFTLAVTVFVGSVNEVPVYEVTNNVPPPVIPAVTTL